MPPLPAPGEKSPKPVSWAWRGQNATGSSQVSTCSLARARRSKWADGDSPDTVRMWPEQPHIWAQCRGLRPWPTGDLPGTQDAEDAPVSRAGTVMAEDRICPGEPQPQEPLPAPCPAPGSSATASIRTRGREESGYRSGGFGVSMPPPLWACSGLTQGGQLPSARVPARQAEHPR